MNKYLAGSACALVVLAISTPAPAPIYMNKGSTAVTSGATEPPDPCIAFKERRAHERCVTRQMNMNAVPGGGCAGGEGSTPMIRKAGGAQMEIGTHRQCLNPQPLPPG